MDLYLKLKLILLLEGTLFCTTVTALTDSENVKGALILSQLILIGLLYYFCVQRVK
jgi:hypothetical protein